jgi:hypothetical protein
MAKRKRIMNIEKMLKEGRGQGISSNYKPWIRIQDVPSLGRATRLKGIKTGRQHEFLSDLERNYFYILEYSDKVIDIREQFPLLPLEDTILIAKELGIEHPKKPGTEEFVVMTTDFLITLDSSNEKAEVARTLKYRDDLLNKRVLEKFEIERRYWEQREVEWSIVTENEIDKDIVNNISYVHGYSNITDLDCFVNIAEYELKDIIYEFIRRIVDSNKTMRSICNEFDNDMSLEKGSSLSLFKYLVINKIINIDINKKLDINSAIPILCIKEDLINKVEAI